MQITRSSIETQTGPADWFTGDVYIDAVAAPAATSTVAAALVHFTPGARTAWHTHPHGETIFVTEGVGRCQRERDHPARRPRLLPARRESLSRSRARPLHGPRRHAAERRERLAGQLGRAHQRRAVRTAECRPMRPRTDEFDRAGIEDELRALSQAKWSWTTDGELDRLADLFDDELVFVHANGYVTSNAEWMGEPRSRRSPAWSRGSPRASRQFTPTPRPSCP